MEYREAYACALNLAKALIELDDSLNTKDVYRESVRSSLEHWKKATLCFDNLLSDWEIAHGEDQISTLMGYGDRTSLSMAYGEMMYRIREQPYG